MRLFVAAWPDPAAAARLAALPRPALADVRWSRPDQWHVTLAFLGEVAEAETVTAALAALSGSPPARAQLGPATERLTAGVLGIPVAGLDALAAEVRSVLGASGLAYDRRPFRGHCTLARVRRGRRVPPALLGQPLAASWSVTAVEVVSSVAAAGGSHYAALATVRLVGA